MPHRDWCGKPCGDCNDPCALDESMPCGPDCENLYPDGSRDYIACLKCGCDAYYENEWGGYLKYLKHWADSHSGPEHYRCSPAGFDEWLANDNEARSVDSTASELIDKESGLLQRIEEDETFAEAVFEQIDIAYKSDEEPWCKKARQLARAYCGHAALLDDFLMTVCGWSFSTLMLQAEESDKWNGGLKEK